MSSPAYRAGRDDPRRRLAELVGAAPPGLLRPDRSSASQTSSGPTSASQGSAGPTSASPGSAGRGSPPGPLRLLDALDLGGGLFVAVVADAAGGRWTVPLISDGPGVRRARPGDGVAAALTAALGMLGVAAPAPFSAACWHTRPAAGERAVTADQTNESVIVGEAAVVKWAVRLPGDGDPEQPAPARLATLGAAGFPHTPRPWGMLRWRSAAGAVTLATVTDYLPGAADGWDWAVQDVASFGLGAAELADALAPPRALGSLTAQLHVALAGAGEHHAGRDDLERWRRRALDDLDEALAGRGPHIDRLAARAGPLRAAFAQLADHTGTPLIDVHGDLHVGQVLRAPAPGGGHRYAVTDFDGNPVLPPAERVLPAPAALDVAGMLASLDHVGRVVLRRREGVEPGRVRAWIPAAQREYLRSYRDGLAASGRTALLDERLLWPLRLHQEVREHLYAIHHLPHWWYVPDAALCDLLPGPTAPDQPNQE